MALHPGTSFPVGKVEFLDLYPLDFLEFLSAMGNDELVKLLESKDFSLITSFKGKYIDLLKQYYYIGGMPAVVASFIENSDYSKVPAENLQAKSLKSYCQKYKPKYAIRTSMSDYRHEEWLTNVPLYIRTSTYNISFFSVHLLALYPHPYVSLTLGPLFKSRLRALNPCVIFQ